MDSGLTAESSEARRHPFLWGWRLVATAALIALAVLLVIRSFFFDVYHIPSTSMEPTFEPGDRLIVAKQQGDIERGSVVVFDGAGSFAPYQSGSPWARDPLKTAGQWFGLVGSDTVYIKRVIGVGGDTVECCDAGGYLLVNGQRLEEPYLPEGEAPSDVSFSVQVPQGRIWVMGDNRSKSTDSRALLGAPGGGMIRADKVIGSPVYTVWPRDRIGPSATTHG